MEKILTHRKKTIIYNYAVYIFISIILIVSLNHYGLKLINGLRAFISGESLYMKAQHQATRQLTNYIFTSNPKHYDLFIENLEVPVSDSLARVSMDKKESQQITYQLLLKAKNLPEDAKNIIWVYNNFKNFDHFENAVKIWKEADLLIIELEKLSREIKATLTQNPEMEMQKRKEYAMQIDHLSRLITIKGNDFDRSLITAVTFVNRAVLLLIMLNALIIGACLLVLSIKYINRLTALQKDTQIQNEVLMQTNTELDLFTNSVSHDLRAPISSLQGLISLAEIEQSDAQRTDYFTLMKQILARQDSFILKIIQFSRNKRIDLNEDTIHLPTFFENIVEDLKYSVLNTPIDITYKIAPQTIITDAFRLDIICRNVLSNAIKYSDSSKAINYINIIVDIKDNELEIFIEDNGIGIEESHQEKIFEMFYVTSHHNKGSGIGLYLTQQMINKMNGKAKFNSVFGEGSAMTINIPTCVVS